MVKKRLDILLVEKGLAESRNSAQRLIMAGLVLVNGLEAHKPSDMASVESEIQLKQRQKYVSRGGEKLEKALVDFGFENLQGKTCVDVGASTGGFTDCLLKHGAKKVFCIDVGYGQLHASLRIDPRVINMERKNVREVGDIPERVDLVTIDVSFISLKTVTLAIRTWFDGYSSNIIALIKPQFEVGREIAARGRGVIRDSHIHSEVIKDLEIFFENAGYRIHAVSESPILGPKGNKEFLIHLSINGES